MVNVVKGGIWQFVYDTKRPAFFGRGSGGFDIVVVKGVHSYHRKGNGRFLKCKKHCTRYTDAGRLGSWTCSQHG